MQTEHKPAGLLLTPEEVAWKLFEEASLTGWRTNGRDGLSPVVTDPEPRFRPQDVDAFVRTHLQAA